MGRSVEYVLGVGIDVVHIGSGGYHQEIMHKQQMSATGVRTSWKGSF